VSTRKQILNKPLDNEEKNRSTIFKSVLSATMTLEFGMGLQRGIFNNFVVEVLGIEPSQLGFVQGVREIPGLLTAPLAYASTYFKEHVWAGLCIMVAALGLLLHVTVLTVPMLVIATLVMSTGFHLFYPVQSSMVMKASLPKQRATRMGQINSGASVASLGAFLMVMLVSKSSTSINYALFHLIAGVAVLAGGLVILVKKAGNSGSIGKSYNYNPRYITYYILTFLGGARRHITVTFAGFLLVRTFGTPVGTMVILSACSSLVSIFTRPMIGKLIDKWGEQKSLILNYLLATLLFAGYAFLKVPGLLYLIFVLDNGLLGFDVAITTHLGKIAPREDLSSAYAMGSTINHISGVAVPMIGGYIWDFAGAPVVFLLGAAVALWSLVYSMKLHNNERVACNL
jgi:predicted MFS family arabinose efflux permease